MWQRCLYLIMAVLLAAVPALAQGAFKPRNAAEEHAWRLYNQYQASKQKEAQLSAAIKQKSGDIKTVNVGVVPIAPAVAAAEDAAELAKMREQLNAELTRQQNLEAAWKKNNFYWRYGDLKDSGVEKYDPQTKQKMDKIKYALIYFPFYVNDGTYNGEVRGEVEGRIRLVISENKVSGTITGTYATAGGDVVDLDGEGLKLAFTGTLTGTLSATGVLQLQFTGAAGDLRFTGTLSGNISGGMASGNWKTQNQPSASGSFMAKR